jgi:Ca2+-binding RTX toxin-like protein
MALQARRIQGRVGVGSGSLASSPRAWRRSATCLLGTALSVVVAGLIPGFALGATAEVRQDTKLLFRAGAEVNDVHISYVARRGEVTITDRQEPIAVGQGCVAENPHTVICSLDTDYQLAVNVHLGGGDDRVDATEVNARFFWVTVRAGNGDDLIRGPHAGSNLWGEAGDDRIKVNGRLRGGTAHGGPGDDTLFGSSGRDKLHGDAGDDSLSGGPGSDRLKGGSGNDTLRGGEGGDLVGGGPGHDRVIGGPGKDTLLGGAGNDVIRAADGERDLVRCAAGRDRAIVDSVDVVWPPGACERVRRR